jgi:hypothetical protein
MTRQRNKERQKGKRKTKGRDKQGKTMNKNENWKTPSTNAIIVPQRFGNSGRKQNHNITQKTAKETTILDFKDEL